MKVISNNGYNKWKSDCKVKSCKTRSDEKMIASGKKHLSGFANLSGIFLVCFSVAGFLYLYSMNSSTMQGYKIKSIENDISKLNDKYEKLEVREAELNSLYKLEADSTAMNMKKVDNAVYMDDTNPIAFR